MVALFCILPIIVLIIAGVWVFFSNRNATKKETVQEEYEERDWRTNEIVKKKRNIEKEVVIKSKKVQFWSAIVLGIACLFILFFVPGSFHQVDAGEVAVVKVWGDAKEVRTAGIHFDLWISHKYETYDCKVQQIVTTTETYSKDGQTMDVELVIQYQIQQDKAMNIAKNYGGLQMLESRIETVALEKMKSVLSQKQAMTIIETRADVSKDVTDAVTEAIKDDYYANITTVVLTDISFTDAFEKTVEDKMIAEQEKLKAQYEKEKAIIQAEQALEVAKKEAEAKLALAEGDANAQKAIANAEAYSASIKIVELARTLGYEVNETVNDQVTIYKIDWSKDTDGKGKEQILSYLKYLEYLAKWNGELPDVVTGSDTTIMVPTEPKA